MMRNRLLMVLLLALAVSTSQTAKAGEGHEGLSEKDSYLDLNTGNQFHLIYDYLNDVYNRDDLFELDLYVNNNTRDTFWLAQALKVNNALLRDAAGKYRVDPMKVKRDGDGYMVKPSAVEVQTPSSNAVADKPHLLKP